MSKDLLKIVQNEIERYREKPDNFQVISRVNQFANTDNLNFPNSSISTIPIFVNSYIHNRGKEYTASTIAFANTNPDTITDSANGFLVFAQNDIIVVTGSTNNDNSYKIATLTAGTITLPSAAELTAESAGASIRIRVGKTPALEHHLKDQLPAPQTNKDGFNTQLSYVQLAEKGQLVENYIPQYVNRRYSFYAHNTNVNSGGLLVLDVAWDEEMLILITDSIGLTTTLFDTSPFGLNPYGSFHGTIPISTGQSRIDILIYNQDSVTKTFKLNIALNAMLAVSAPLPSLRHAIVEKTINIMGDGAFHDSIKLDKTYTASTISFDNVAKTGTTIFFTDAFIHANTISFTSSTTISDSGSGLVTAGFEVGMDITVGGSSSNNGVYTISTVSAGTITVASGITTESAGKYIIIKGQGAIEDSGAGFGIFSDGDTIKISGSAFNDGIYTADDVVTSSLIVVNEKIKSESAGANVTIKRRPEINDTANGFGSFSASDVITVKTVSGTNDGAYIVRVAAVGKLTADIESGIVDETAGSAGSVTITTGAITHHGELDGVNFPVRDVMLIKQITELYPTSTYPTKGYDPSQSGLLIKDADINGDTAAGVSHSHSDGTYATSTDSGHSHDVTGTSGSEATHTHAVGTLKLDDAKIISGGARTEKDRVTLPSPTNIDETVKSIIDVQIVKDSTNLIVPALFAKITATTISFVDVVRVGTSLSFTNVVSEITGVTFNDANPDTIVRASGSWTTDGFLSGMKIRIRNSIFNDGDLTINTVTSSTITLVSTDKVTAENNSLRTIIIKGQSKIGDSGAGFVAAEFKAGMFIKVSSSVKNDGVLKVNTVAASTLTLEPEYTLNTESAGANITIDGMPLVKDSGNGLITAGFVNNIKIEITGATDPDNNKIFTLRNVSAGEMFLDVTEDVDTEAAGASVTIKSVAKNGFYVKYKAASNRAMRIHYTALAYGMGTDRPIGLI